jgi:hypothetical protein
MKALLFSAIKQKRANTFASRSIKINVDHCASVRTVALVGVKNNSIIYFEVKE